MNDIEREELVIEAAEETFEQDGVYLAGPIRCLDDDGRTWREEFEKDYWDDFEINNPLNENDPEEVNILNDSIQYADEDDVTPSELTYTDKSLIIRSEAVFVGLPEVISRGSCMEMMYAYMKNIPVFVWKMDGQEESAWIFHHSEFMHEERDEVVSFMERYL